MQKINIGLKDVKIGTKLELEVTDIFNSDKSYCYVSQLLDIKPDGTLVIATPIAESKLIFVPNNTKVVVIFQHDKFGLIAFDSIVNSKDNADKISTFNMKVSGEFYKIQRRNHYRLETMLDVFYAEMPESLTSKIKNENDIEFTKTISKDISGSGLRFVSPKEIASDTPLIIKIELPDGDTIEARCVVVRCAEEYIGSSKKYSIGVKFTAISKINEEKLIRYIFMKQKEILKQKKV